MLIINLWGAPGSGKSTTAAGLFFLMKINKKRVELVTEFAKELVWDRQEHMFGDQAFIFSEQNRRLRRLADHEVEFVINDSPLPLPAFYQPQGYLPSFTPLVMEQFNRYNNLNYLLERKHSFEAIGRRHNEEQSEQIAVELENFMKRLGIPYEKREASPHTPQQLFEDILRRMPPPMAMPLVGPDNS